MHTPGAEVLTCRYRWTQEEAWKISRFHWRGQIRRPFRWLYYSVLGLILAVCLWSLLTAGVSMTAVLLLIASAYFLLFRRIEARWWHRRRFRQRPDRDKLIEFRSSAEGISSEVEDLGSGTTTWAGLYKVLRTPEGFLVYPNEGIMYWLPFSGFPSKSEVEAFEQLARSKVKIYSVL